MRKLLFYSILINLVSVASCKKDDLTLSPTDYPSNYAIDINQDGIDDFFVEYNQLTTSDVPVSGSSIIGSINPGENISTLYSTSSGYLFLSQGDTIYQSPPANLNWYSYSSDLVSKDWDNENGWDDLWKVNSTQNEYYFTFLLENGVNTELGWMKLEIDITNGEISVIDQSLSSSNFIVIN